MSIQANLVHERRCFASLGSSMRPSPPRPRLGQAEVPTTGTSPASRTFFNRRTSALNSHPLGYPEFDEAFIIKGNDEQKLRALFADERIRQLLEMQPSVHLTVKDDEGWFSKTFPEGVDELHFMVVGVIKDVERLKSLDYLFAEVLNQLCHIGSAYEDDPQLEL